jgi:hypothetical protein
VLPLFVYYDDHDIKKREKLCIGPEIRPKTGLIRLKFVQPAANDSEGGLGGVINLLKTFITDLLLFFEF